MAFFYEDKFDAPGPEGRVEAVWKVTGKGKYAAEYPATGMAYAVLAGSTVAAGTIKKINLANAQQVQGVLGIITHQQKPLVPGMATEQKIREARFGLPVFHTDKIYFKGQPIAMVVASSFEEATYAASLIEAEYEAEPFEVDFDKAQAKVPLTPAGRERGSMDAWANAAKTVEAEYNIKAEVHNPMEMHATIAHWLASDQLKLYDKNQGVNSVQRTIARLFDIPAQNVEVRSEFVGGGFGSGLRVWPHTLAAVMAARLVNKPVKLVLTRQQMFCSVGYRPASWQKVKLGANADGRFTGILHQAKNGTSVYENFSEGITRVTRLVYDFPNLKTDGATVPLNLGTPTWMRGPGDCTGSFAVESAIDELAAQLNIDPVQIRLKNLAKEKNPDNGMPWSSHYLPECIERGAGMIGWASRRPQPRQVEENGWWVGYGTAVGMWNAGRSNASAGIEMGKDGSITIKTAMTDIGTGTGTSMQNMAHTHTGIDKAKIKVMLGSSDLPPAGSQGGSNGLSSISGAVAAVCDALKEKLAGYAAKINPVYAGLTAKDVLLTNTGVALQAAGNQAVSFEKIWDEHKLDTIDVEASSGPGNERQKYAFCSSAAHFCKVRVHAATGKVKVERLVCVADGGSIVSEKPAANQMSGAAVGGIGMALMEEQVADGRLGGLVGDDFAGYHFAVNADAPIIEVAFINKPDPYINPSGAKGLGEVGIIGVAAAITNAIFNATGKRLRNLPVTPDKVLA